MDDVAFVSSRMSGVYVTSSEEGKGVYRADALRHAGKPDAAALSSSVLVNMAHLQEIRLEG